MALFKAESPLIRDFNKDQIPFVRERVSITLLIGAILVPLFGVVDYLLFPQHVPQFLAIRIAVGLVCLGLLALNLRWDFGERSSYLGVAGVYVTALGIIRMIIVTGGYTTTYYAGLNLIFLAFCAIMTVGVRFVLLHSVILYLIYVGSVLAFSPRENINLFIANNMFIFTTLVIGLIASSTDYRHRFRQYQLRLKLQEAQSQLRVYSRMLENR